MDQNYNILFLVWYDPDSRHSTVEKIRDALAAYSRRFTTAPNLVLVHPTDEAALAGVEVRTLRTVQLHHFWVGSTTSDNVANGIEA